MKRARTVVTCILSIQINHHWYTGSRCRWLRVVVTFSITTGWSHCYVHPVVTWEGRKPANHFFMSTVRMLQREQPWTTGASWLFSVKAHVAHRHSLAVTMIFFLLQLCLESGTEQQECYAEFREPFSNDYRQLWRRLHVHWNQTRIFYFWVEGRERHRRLFLPWELGMMCMAPLYQLRQSRLDSVTSHSRIRTKRSPTAVLLPWLSQFWRQLYAPYSSYSASHSETGRSYLPRTRLVASQFELVSSH